MTGPVYVADVHYMYRWLLLDCHLEIRWTAELDLRDGRQKLGAGVRPGNETLRLIHGTERNGTERNCVTALSLASSGVVSPFLKNLPIDRVWWPTYRRTDSSNKVCNDFRWYYTRCCLLCILGFGFDIYGPSCPAFFFRLGTRLLYRMNV